MNLLPSLRAALIIAALAMAGLGACNRAPAPDQANAPAASTWAPPTAATAPASSATQSTIAPSTHATSPTPATTATTVPPTATTPVSVMDCARTEGKIEAMVCEDAGLAVLDRQLADVYAQGLEHAGDKATLRAGQREWRKQRNDCANASDAKACVRLAYQARIVELRIQNGLVSIPKATQYTCNDNNVPFSAAFYSEDPRAAMLTYGNDQAVAIAIPVASGTRYVGNGVEFREQAGKVKVDFHGKALDCTAKP